MQAAIYNTLSVAHRRVVSRALAIRIASPGLMAMAAVGTVFVSSY